jgi:glycine cleavage system H protein
MAERATRRRLWIGRLRSVALALGVNLALLAGLDLMLVKLDLLSPPFTYGLEGVGFGYAGVRRSSDFGVVTPGAGEAVTIAMVGDSHSQLAFDGRPLESHEFVLERRLRAAGIPALMISAGRGRYSPLQEYLLFKLAIEEPYHPRLLVMNVYSGNDFYDMLRPDDRPHYLRDSAVGIAIEDPEWITFVNPSTRRWIERSRLLWAVDELSSRLGYPRVVTRLRMLGAAARQPGHTTAETVRYLSDLVYVDLPEVTDLLEQGQPYAEVESVKAVADVYAPLSGEIVEINEALADNLDLASKDPFHGGWLVKFRMSHPNEAETLMTAEQYDAYVKTQAH